MTGAWGTLGVDHHQLDNLATALAATDRALSLDPDDASALEGRARVMISMGRLDEAEKATDRRLELDADPWVRAGQAYIWMWTDRAMQALDLTNELVSLQPRSLEFRMERARCYQ